MMRKFGTMPIPCAADSIEFDVADETRYFSYGRFCFCRVPEVVNAKLIPFLMDPRSITGQEGS